jgi:hypothetical protein
LGALAEALGFETGEGGLLSISRRLEALVVQWIHRVWRQRMGPDLAFPLVQ